jgi:Ca2+-transporting ATPase
VALAVVKYGEDNYGLPIALTMGVTTLALCHLVAAVTTRDPERSALTPHTFANRRFTYMALLVIGLTIFATEFGFLQRILDTVSMNRNQWGICLIATGILLAIYEIAKLILKRTGWFSTAAAQSTDLQPAPSLVTNEAATA